MLEIDQFTDDDWKRAEQELSSLGAEILPPAPHHEAVVRNLRYQGCILPKIVIPVWKDVIKFEAKEDDIYVDTFYKAGTTWMQQIVYLICNDPDGNNENYHNIDESFPFLEFGKRELDLIVNMKSPRFIKTHLCYKILPQSIKDKKCKIVYVARNPKDVIVSSYFFIKKLTLYKFSGTIEDHAENILSDKGMYCPFWGHVLDFWKARNNKNILFIKYEDMQKDLRDIVKRVAEFLEKPLTEAQIQSVTERSTFSAMSKDQRVNRHNWVDINAALEGFKFMRKGETGDWKNHLSEALSERIDEWTEENTKGTGLSFDYEI